MKPLQDEKRSLEDKKKNLSERMNRWVKLAQDTFKFVCSARTAFEKASLQDKKIILVSLGSNFLLKDKKLYLDLLKPYLLIEKRKDDINEVLRRFEPSNKIDIKTQKEYLFSSSPILSRGEDSNLRRENPAVLQTAPIDHSGTPG